MHIMSLFGPLAPCCGAAWGAKLKEWSCAAIGNGTFYALCFVEGDDPLEGLGGPRVLGEDTPGKLKSAKKNLTTRVEM